MPPSQLDDLFKGMDPEEFARLLGGSDSRWAASPTIKPTADSADPLPPPGTDHETREAIVAFIVEPVAVAIEALIAESSLLPSFAIENPFDLIHRDIYKALTNRLAGLTVVDLGLAVPAAADGSIRDIFNAIEKDQAGVVFLCGSRSVMPRRAVGWIRKEGWMVVPRLSAARLRDYAKQFRAGIGMDGVALDWARWLQPEQLILARTIADADWLAGLEQLVERQRDALTIGRPVKIDDLIGMDAATSWAKHLVEDIEAYRQHRIGWAELDRGALLAGPPGTGKTTLGRAIARESGVAFLAVSVSQDWMAAGALDDCIQAMARSFTMARQQRPSILFIDEIDSAGNRARFSGNNATWNTGFLNALLTQFDSLVDEEIVVIGATNDPENVDPALRRAGRLDRLIRIPRPGVIALAGLYRATLRSFGATLDDADLRRVAESSLGLTGADVIVLVRGAHRRARHDDARAITADDLLNEIYRIPPTAERKPIDAAQLRISAIHEAGHAIVALAMPGLRERLTMVSVMPDEAAGTGGFVAFTPLDCNETRASLSERICVALAGRIAETMMLGPDATTTGAGGTDNDCDLAKARDLALKMTGLYGFSDQRPDWWSAEGNVAEAEAIIAGQRALALEILTGRRAWYQRLVDALTGRHRMTRAEVLALEVGGG